MMILRDDAARGHLDSQHEHHDRLAPAEAVQGQGRAREERDNNRQDDREVHGPEHGGRGHDLIARLYGGDNHPVDREEPYDAEQQGEDSGAGAARDLAGVGSAAGRCRLRCAMRYGPWILNTFHKDDPLFQGFANISVPVAISGVGYGSATPSPPSTSTTDSLHASSPSICWGAGIDESPISSDRRTCRRRRQRARS